MAAITVFVDRLVQGDLPSVCAKTGQPAGSLVTVQKPVGGLGAAAWLLLFLGPLGWIALVILATVGSGREILSVQLPYSDEAWARYRKLRTIRLAGVIAAFASLLTPFLLPGSVPAPGFIIAIGGVLVASVAQIALAFSEVALSLDASRRWVTLTGVHEHFAQAVNATSDRELRGWPG